MGKKFAYSGRLQPAVTRRCGFAGLRRGVSCLSRKRLEYGEAVFERVEVGTAGQEIEEPGVRRFNGRAHVCALIAGKIAYNDDVAGAG